LNDSHATDELRIAIDKMPAMMWIVAADGSVSFLNRRWLEYCGLSEEVALRDPTAVIHPDDLPGALDKWQSSRANRTPYEAELRMRRFDGKFRRFLVRTVPHIDEQGNVLKWYGNCTDIEQARRAEQRLSGNRELLQSMLVTLPVGVTVLDPAGNIILLNDASSRIWGKRLVSGDVPAARARGFWHDSGRPVAADEWASVQALSQGKMVLNQLVDIDTFDGRRKTIKNTGVPIRDPEGTIIGAVVINEDVTDQVRAERALRENAGRLHRLSRRLIELQEEERRHLSLELHDEFGQLLTAVSLHMQVAKGQAGAEAQQSLNECAALIERASERLRGLALELRPSMLETAGLDGTLRWLAAQYSRQGNMAVTVTGHADGLSSDVAISCFRVVQEALTNVLRHANARQVLIDLEQSADRLRLGIEDDGVGFDLAVVRTQAEATGHLGLVGMEERIEILGGRLEIDAKPQSGTRINVSLPLTPRRIRE
jgi:PAS domain S-box-containing protein